MPFSVLILLFAVTLGFQWWDSHTTSQGLRRGHKELNKVLLFFMNRIGTRNTFRLKFVFIALLGLYFLQIQTFYGLLVLALGSAIAPLWNSYVLYWRK